MKTLDITIDMETCALCPTAAVMSIGAVAWDRNAQDTPFMDFSEMGKHVDLRSSFTDGFMFDQETADWWAKQSAEAKGSLLEEDEEPLIGIKDVIMQLFSWIKSMQALFGAEEIYLWSQGSDFDIAILRHICYKYKLEIPVPYTHFRDHRTFYMEGARMICRAAGSEFNEKDAYKMVEEYGGVGQPHNPVYDCKRSIYSTWQMMKMLCLIAKTNK